MRGREDDEDVIVEASGSSLTQQHGRVICNILILV